MDRWRKISLLIKLITVIFHLLSADPGLLAFGGVTALPMEQPIWLHGAHWYSSILPQADIQEEDEQHKPKPFHVMEGKGRRWGGSDPGIHLDAEQPQGLPTDRTHTNLVAALAPSFCYSVA